MRFCMGLDAKKDNTFFDDTVGVFLGWFLDDDTRGEPNVYDRASIGECLKSMLNLHESFSVCRQANCRLLDTGVVREVS